MKQIIISSIGLFFIGSLFLNAHPKNDVKHAQVVGIPYQKINPLIRVYGSIQGTKWVDIVTGKGDTLRDQFILNTKIENVNSRLHPKVLEVTTATYDPYTTQRIKNPDIQNLEKPKDEIQVLTIHTIYITMDKAATSPRSLASGATFWKWPKADIFIKENGLIDLTPYIQLAQIVNDEFGESTKEIPLGDKVQLHFKKM